MTSNQRHSNTCQHRYSESPKVVRPFLYRHSAFLERQPRAVCIGLLIHTSLECIYKNKYEMRREAVATTVSIQEDAEVWF